jgi:hypothetical protein
VKEESEGDADGGSAENGEDWRMRGIGQMWGGVGCREFRGREELRCGRSGEVEMLRVNESPGRLALKMRSALNKMLHAFRNIY